MAVVDKVAVSSGATAEVLVEAGDKVKQAEENTQDDMERLMSQSESSEQSGQSSSQSENGSHDASCDHIVVEVCEEQSVANNSTTENTSEGENTSLSGQEVQISKVEVRDPTAVSNLRLLLEVIIPFGLAGLGTVFAGVLLGKFEKWPVFQALPEMLTLVPPLLGLKGNLEMTLAARLSTQANLGNMDKWSELCKMICGNLALTQLQATCLGLLVAMGTMLLEWLPQGHFDHEAALVFTASSVATAMAASLLLGSVMVLVIVVSRKLHINPDNIATPIAASLGDITTLSLLAWLSHGFFRSVDHPVAVWAGLIYILVAVALVPLWVSLSRNNPYTKTVLFKGWSPFAGALAISTVCGVIFSSTAKRHEAAVVFQPIINGVGGNLVAIQASRISTSLHFSCPLGELPDGSAKGCPNICTVFCCRGVGHGGGSGLLLLLVLPGQVLFTLLVSIIHPSQVNITPLFGCLYLSAAFTQVLILLYFSTWLVHQLWIRKLDPDNFSIPYLTALGDLLGALLLAAVFKLMDFSNSSNIAEDVMLSVMNSTSIDEDVMVAAINGTVTLAFNITAGVTAATQF